MIYYLSVSVVAWSDVLKVLKYLVKLASTIGPGALNYFGCPVFYEQRVR